MDITGNTILITGAGTESASRPRNFSTSTATD